MRKTMKKLSAIILIAAMIFGVFPNSVLTASAEESNVESTVIAPEVLDCVRAFLDNNGQSDKAMVAVDSEELEGSVIVYFKLSVKPASEQPDLTVEEEYKKCQIIVAQNSEGEWECTEFKDDIEFPSTEPEEPEKPEEPKPVVPEQHTPGWLESDGEWYYYNASGEKAYGWVSVGGVWYYLDKDNTDKPGVMVASQHKRINGRMYAFAANGAMKTAGWILEDEGWYYAEPGGALKEGWAWIDGAWYYLDGANVEYPALMVSDESKEIAGATYFFNSSGAMMTGWVHQPEGWYYANGSGAVATGWLWTGGAWYYLDGENTEYPGLMVSNGSKEVAGATYFFFSSGAMETGWVKREEGWYLTDGSGAKVTGWHKVGTKWYYLDGENADYPGLMLENCEKQIGGITYTFTADGSMKAGWEQDSSGNWYYYDTTYGQKVSGWQLIGAWYYFDPADENKMVSGGWRTIDNTWYYFYGSGAMATEWINLGGTWYYLGSNGVMRTGWQMIGGTWYYFYGSGAMACNTVIDGYTLQANGAMLTGHQATMAARAQMYGSNTNNLILVDRGACKVAVFAGRAGAWSMVHYWDCAPGKPSTPTVAGTFTVSGKGRYFDSGSSRCYWYTQFYGNYLFHSVLYSKYNGGLVDGRVGMQLSHGCVRLKIENAKWIYDTIPVGTKVVIY